MGRAAGRAKLWSGSSLACLAGQRDRCNGGTISAADGSRHREVALHHRDGCGGITRRGAVAAMHLRAELGDVLLMIVDHVAADLTIESAAVEAAQNDGLAPGLRRQRHRNAQAQPRCYALRLGESATVVANEHRTEIADLRVRAPVLDHPAKGHFRIIALNGLVKELRGRRGEGRAREQDGRDEDDLAKHECGLLLRCETRETRPWPPCSYAGLTGACGGAKRRAGSSEGLSCARSFFPGRAARPSEWARRSPKRAGPRKTCLTRSTKRWVKACSG